MKKKNNPYERSLVSWYAFAQNDEHAREAFVTASLNMGAPICGNLKSAYQWLRANALELGEKGVCDEIETVYLQTL